MDLSDKELARAILAALEVGDPDAFLGDVDHPWPTSRRVTIDGSFDFIATAQALRKALLKVPA